ncbi:MAG: hypothetical protein M1825_003258 [Sarcosagium campestre]|nr:MAG: hypothetical protein M1825_003258 [Sarcosagium campestre]
MKVTLRSPLMPLIIMIIASVRVTEAYWRLGCSFIQTGRIDTITNFGQVSSHVHKIAGPSNFNVTSTYETLRAADCTSCSIQSDKSAYWTPSLYYQHASNGTFSAVAASGMAVYYLGRGDNASAIVPFPPGFRMLSGDMLARSYDTTKLTHNGQRRIADRVSFACLGGAGSPAQPETPGMQGHTSCADGMRAQVHFQSCWNGVDLFLPGNAHVAYLSGIDTGVCPVTHPVPLMHLFYEVLYSMDSIGPEQGEGRFVFSNGDPTGYGFHGDFVNGWDPTVLEDAIKQCGSSTNGEIRDCAPLVPSNDEAHAVDCPPRPAIVSEATDGLLERLPGCVEVTDGPESATLADVVCAARVSQPALTGLPWDV